MTKKTDHQLMEEHLVIMLAKDFWTDEDLTPLQLASE